MPEDCAPGEGSNDFGQRFAASVCVLQFRPIHVVDIFEHRLSSIGAFRLAGTGADEVDAAREDQGPQAAPQVDRRLSTHVVGGV